MKIDIFSTVTELPAGGLEATCHCHASCPGKGQAHLERIRPSRVVAVGSVRAGAGLLKMRASTSTVLPRPICRQQWEGVALLGDGLYGYWHFTLTQLQAALDRVVFRPLQQPACRDDVY